MLKCRNHRYFMWFSYCKTTMRLFALVDMNIDIDEIKMPRLQNLGIRDILA